MKRKIGHGPIVPEMIDKMNHLARVFDDYINGTAKDRAGAPKRWGFVVLVVPVDIEGNDKRANYISNINDRKEVVTLFKEMVARFEGQPEIEVETRQ